MVAIAQKMTWKEFREMEVDDDDHFIYELIDGILMKRTSPSLQHQRVSRRLSEMLGAFLKANPIGEYFPAPTDVSLDAHTGIVPDISFVSNERAFIIDNDDYIAGAPDLIIEIISPGNIKRDRVDKKNLYERFAVKEFWLIDPANRSVEVYLMEGDAYQLHALEEGEGKVVSTVINGFVLEVKELFESK
jgi:Uma2 family endonuclease